MNTNKNVDYAKQIGDFLLNKSHYSDTGIFWNSFRPGSVDDEIDESSTIDLYSGNPGISLFFLMLYNETKESRYLDAVEQSLKWAFSEVDKNKLSFGLFNGIYGLLMVASKFMVVKGDLMFEEDCNKILQDLSLNLPNIESTSGDIISGHCGSIIGLLNIVDDTIIKVPDELLLFHIEGIFDYIVFRNERLFFSQEHEIPLLGFSHGQSGVAFTIYQLGLLFNQKWLINLSNHLFESELGLAGNTFDFPDFRSGLYFQDDFTETTFDQVKNFQKSVFDMFAWCHGLPGIAMAHLFVHRNTQSDKSLKLITRFKDEFLSKIDTNMIHQYCLCHGVHGNMLFLSELSKSLNDKSLHRLIDDFNKSSFEQLVENDFYFKNHKQFNDLSLMNGITGIGFYYLKLGSHDVLFDVLTPQIPKINKEKLPIFPIDFKTFIKNFTKREFTFFENLDLSKINNYSSDIIKEIEKGIPIENRLYWSFEKEISTFKMYHTLDYRSFLAKESKASRKIISNDSYYDLKLIVHYENNLPFSAEEVNYVFSTNGHKYQLFKVSNLEYEILSSSNPSDVIQSILSSLEDVLTVEKFKSLIHSMINAGLLFLSRN